MEQPYRIAVVGGTGKVGRYIAQKALERGFQVRMLVRNPDRLTVQENNLEIMKGDAQSIDSIRSLLKDSHIVINTLGQPVRSLPIYSIVTGHILTAMKELGLRRYIGVTGASLTVEGDRKRLVNRLGAKMFEILFPPFMADKKKELHILRESGTEWTLVRLPFVTEGPETGKIREHLTDVPGTRIVNGDIAKFILDQIHDKKYVRKTPCISN